MGDGMGRLLGRAGKGRQGSGGGVEFGNVDALGA